MYQSKSISKPIYKHFISSNHVSNNLYVCSECGLIYFSCRCDPTNDVTLTFVGLMEYIMQGRRRRHWLYNRDYKPINHLFKEWVDHAKKGDSSAWWELCKFAIGGSTMCQDALLAMDNTQIVIDELNRYMDYFDETPVCQECKSTDLCACENGCCPSCNHFDCYQYQCCMHLTGAKEVYQSTIGAIVPVRMTPTTNIQPVTDTMRNCAKILYDSCALPFIMKERCGLEYCASCKSYECKHCVCETCGEEVCEHFFVLPKKTDALVVAWKNQEL